MNLWLLLGMKWVFKHQDMQIFVSNLSNRINYSETQLHVSEDTT